jgi:antitoxin PrlF
MTDLTVMSSKGQIVVPKDVREQLGLSTGTTFAVFGKEDTLILKKVNVPSAKEAFAKVHRFGVEFAKRKGIKEDHTEKIIHKGRRIKVE